MSRLASAPTRRKGCHHMVNTKQFLSQCHRRRVASKQSKDWPGILRQIARIIRALTGLARALVEVVRKTSL